MIRRDRPRWSSTFTLLSILVMSGVAGCTRATPPAPESSKSEPRGVIIRSRVLAAPSLEPIANARVEVVELLGGGKTLAAVTTGDDGCFAVKVPESCFFYRLHVTALGFISERWPSDLELGVPFPQPVVELDDFELRRGFPVHGTVLLPDGTPASSGSVVVVDGLESPYRETRIRKDPTALLSRDGQFHVGVIGPRFGVIADVPGYPVALSEPTSVRERKPFVIQLEHAAPLHGTVVDHRGRPVGNAQVICGPPSLRADVHPERLYGAYQASEVRPRATTTDAAGHFDVPGKSLRRAILSVQHPSYAEVDLSVSSDDNGLEVVLWPARRLTARITKGYESTQRLRWGYLEGSLMVREGDHLLATSVEPFAGSGNLLIHGFSPWSVAWPDGTDDYDLGTIPPPAGTTLVVRVQDRETGVPIPRARVELRTVQWFAPLTPPYRTEDTGAVEIEALAEESVLVLVGHRTHASAWQEVQLASNPTVLEFSLGPASDVVGRVVDDAGESVVDCEVTYELLADPDHRRLPPHIVRTGAQGHFRVPALPSDRETELTFRADGLEPKTVTIATGTARGKADLGDVLLERGLGFAGEVIDQGGRPLVGARVEVWEDRRRWLVNLRTQTAVTGEDGRFEVFGVPAGDYRIRISKEGFESLKEPLPGLPCPPKTFTLVPETSQPYVGTVRYPDGTPVADCGVTLTFESGSCTESATDADGTFEFELDDDGACTVVVGHGCQKFRVASVAQLPADIVVRRGGDLECRIVVQHPELGAPMSASIDLRPTNGESDDQSCGLSWTYLQRHQFRSHTLKDVFAIEDTVELSVEADGFHTFGPVVVSRSPKQVTPLEVTLKRLPPTVPIWIRVVNTEGNPVEGAAVFISEGEPMKWHTVFLGSVAPDPQPRTDANGEAQIFFPQETEAGLWLSSSGYERHGVESPLDHLQDNTLRVTLSRTETKETEH